MLFDIKIYFILCILKIFKKIKYETYYWDNFVCAVNVKINLLHLVLTLKCLSIFNVSPDFR